MAKRRIPYRQRITEYCARNSIIIPIEFDVTKSSDKFVLVDITIEPYQLVARSTYLPSEIVSYISDPKNSSRQFQILDFKRCCELIFSDQAKLIRGNSFECKCKDEFL